MLTRLDWNTGAAIDERDGLVKCAGRGRSELKHPLIEIDSVGSSIEYFDETVLISCTGSAAATIYLANHDLISCARRRCRCWRRCWRRCWCACWCRRRCWRRRSRSNKCQTCNVEEPRGANQRACASSLIDPIE